MPSPTDVHNFRQNPAKLPSLQLHEESCYHDVLTLSLHFESPDFSATSGCNPHNRHGCSSEEYQTNAPQVKSSHRLCPCRCHIPHPHSSLVLLLQQHLSHWLPENKTLQPFSTSPPDLLLKPSGKTGEGQLQSCISWQDIWLSREPISYIC